MAHPYATSAPLCNTGDDAERPGSGVVSLSSNIEQPSGETTSSPDQDVGDGDHSRPTAHRCTPDQGGFHNNDVLRTRDYSDVVTVVSHSSDVSSSSSSLSSRAGSSLSTHFSSSSTTTLTASSPITPDSSTCTLAVAANSVNTPQSFHNHHLSRRSCPSTCGGDHHVVASNAGDQAFSVESRRVQMSERTRFASVLAGGGRGVVAADPTSSDCFCCVDGGAGGNISPSKDLVWWKSTGTLKTVTAPAAACETHPYYSAPHSHPFPPQYQGAADADLLPRNTASASPAAAPKQRSSTSPLLTTASGLFSGSLTPLPPTHPRRSSSPQGASPNVFPTHATGGAVVSSPAPFSSKGACARCPFHQCDTDGCLHRNHSYRGGSVSTSASGQALRRSFSFTSGVWPSSVPLGEARPYCTHCPLSVAAGSHGAPSAPRNHLAAERKHERTVSISSSAHSFSSLARPSVPLPPSPVGTTSNMMAAVWVDLPQSQSGSRCATPLKRNSDTYPSSRRRRTTPRRSSYSPSSVASTLAASITSSLDGGGLVFSCVGGAGVSARRLLVTVSTQTDDNAVVADDGETQTPFRNCLHSDSLIGTANASNVGCGDNAAHSCNVRDPLGSEKEFLGTAGSVSSTSAEVSPRSALESVADVSIDNSADDAALDGKIPRRGVSRAAGDDAEATTTANSSRPLSPKATMKGDGRKDEDNSTNVQGESTVRVCSCHTSGLGSLPLRGGGQTADHVPCVSMSPRADPVPGGQTPPSAPTSSLPTLVKPERQQEHEPAASLQSQAGSLSPVCTPSFTTTGGAAVEGAGQSSHVHLEKAHRGAVKANAPAGLSVALTADEAKQLSPPQPNPSSLSEEVHQLRAELTRMRLHYEQVVQQLQKMQEKMATEGAAPGLSISCTSAQAPAAVEQSAAEGGIAIGIPPALPAASPTSPLGSVSEQGQSGALASLMESTSSASRKSDGSLADAVATLGHVREALQRTRQRVSYS